MGETQPSDLLIIQVDWVSVNSISSKRSSTITEVTVEERLYTMGLGGLEPPTSRLSGLRAGSYFFRRKPVILRHTPIFKGVGTGSLQVSSHLDPAGYRSRQRNEQRRKWGSG